MKINKIICDLCENEVDIKKDNGLAMFEYIQAKQLISFAPSADLPKQMSTEEEISSIRYDFCKRCADEIVNLIEKEKQNKKVEQK